MFNGTPHLNIVTQYSDDSDDGTSIMNSTSINTTNTPTVTNCDTITTPSNTSSASKPYRHYRQNRKGQFKVGTVVTSVAVGELQPLKEGQKRRQRTRLRGKILKKSPTKESEWLVRFSNGREDYFKQSVLKFDNNDLVTHTLTKSSNNQLGMSTAHSGVLRSANTITPDRSDRKAILDFISTSIIQNKDHNNNDNKATNKLYTSILNTFQPQYPWLTCYFTSSCS